MIIIRRLRKSPATYEEISQCLKQESELQGYDFMISKRTLQRDLEDIALLYGIEISFDFSRKVYHIESEENADLNTRIAEAFELYNSLNLAARISEYVYPEKRNGSGTEMMITIISAIQKRLVVVFGYFKFNEREKTDRKTEPLALREFRKRWYLVARDMKDNQIKSFALDRITYVEVTSHKFTFPEDFNADEYFKDCFGIIRPDDEEEPEEIILSFDQLQGMFIKSMPLHKSQEIITDSADQLVIRLKLYITHDFIMELLSFGENVKVLSPIHLADSLTDIFKNALKQY